jgi:WD40 repeat protein
MICKRFFLIVVTSCALVSAMRVATLRDLAAQKVLSENISSNYAPQKVKELLGKEYCRRNIERAWVHLEVQQALALDSYQIVAACFLPDDTCVLGLFDGTLAFFYPQSSDLKNFKAHSERVAALAVSPDMESLFSASYDKTIIQWSLPSLSVIKKIECEGEVSSISFSKEGDLLVIGGADGALWVVRIKEAVPRAGFCVWQPKEMVELVAKFEHFVRNPGQPRTRVIRNLRLCEDVLLSCAGKSIKEFDPQGDTQREFIRDNKDIFGCSTFLKDRSALVCHSNGMIHFLNAKREWSETKLNSYAFSACTVSGDGRFFLTGTQTGEIQLWCLHSLLSQEVRHHSPIHSFSCPSWVKILCFSRYSDLFLVVSTGSVNLFSLKDIEIEKAKHLMQDSPKIFH